MHLRAHDNNTFNNCLFAGLATIIFAASAGAQSTPTPTDDTTASQVATTAETDEARPVGTSGQLPSPIPRTAPAQLRRPASWTANAGYEADTHDTGYAFAGPHYVRPFAPNTAWVAGANANYLYYEYPSGDGNVRVTAPGVSLRGGVMFGQKNYVQLTAGPSFKRRYITNRDVSRNAISKTNDNVTGLGFGVDASADPTSHNNIYGIYDYNSSDGYQWGRLAYKEQVSNFSWSGSIANFIGAEVIGQGNEDIHSTQIGAFWETAFVPSHVSVMFRGGWKRSTYPLGGTDQSGPWFAIGFWHRIR